MLSFLCLLFACILSVLPQLAVVALLHLKFDFPTLADGLEAILQPN
jgi:hypothetical protein